MPKKIGSVTRSTLVNAPLPSATKTYTVISHSHVINTILQALQTNGFTVEQEIYRCTEHAKVAHGVFLMDYQEDPELKMMYTFSNSYDKTMRFRSAIGVQMICNGAYMVSDLNDWKRKHTGTADNEATESINEHLVGAKIYYDALVEAKRMMSKIEITQEEFGALIGELFIKDYLAIDQISIAKKEYENPSFPYSTGRNNLWTCYNHILYAIKSTHPSRWMQNQVATHLFFCVKYDLIKFDNDNTTPKSEGPVTVVIQGEEVPAIPGILDGVEEFPQLPGFGDEQPVEEPVQKETKNPPVKQVTLEEAIAKEQEAAKEQVTAEQMKGGIAMMEQADEMVSIEREDPEPAEEAEDEIEDDSENALAGEELEEGSLLEEVEEPQEEAFYFPAADYPGLGVGTAFEAEEEYYEVTGFDTMGNIRYIVCKKLDMSVIEPDLAVEGLDEVTEEPVAEEATEETVLPVAEKHVPPHLPKEETILPEDPLEDTTIPANIAASVDPPKPVDPAREVIERELEEIYGYKPNFEYILSGNQYNITLESGESLPLAASYIQSQIKP